MKSPYVGTFVGWTDKAIECLVQASGVARAARDDEVEALIDQARNLLHKARQKASDQPESKKVL
jgi:hypothetical protein